MSSRHLVHPELKQFIDILPSSNLSDEMLKSFREMMAESPSIAAPKAKQVDVQEKYIPGYKNAPNVRVLMYQPQTKSGHTRPAILHIHGGGFISGRPEIHDKRNRYFAQEFSCVVVSVDYRLAPEVPYPGALHDCYATLLWLHQSSHSLNIDKKRIAVIGESAGGGLAAALCLMARDLGKTKIFFQQLIYPMLDDRTVVQSTQNSYSGEFIWTRKDNQYGWKSLLGKQSPGDPDVSSYAAPSREENLENLPPTFISVGALDLFVDENISYAARLMNAGVPTELHVYSGGYHGLDIFPGTQIKEKFDSDYYQAMKAAMS